MHQMLAWFRENHPRRCFYCGVKLHARGGHSPSKKTRDHVVAKSKGGRGRSNYVPACSPCNRKKDAMTIEEFRAVIYAGKPVEFYGEMMYRRSRDGVAETIRGQERR